MPYYLKALERPHHLVAFVTGRDEPLIDERVRQNDRKTPIWHAYAEVWTPRSLPLQISVTLGAKNGVQVWTAETRLLEVGLADVGIHVSLLLPTDETLTVEVRERIYDVLKPDSSLPRRPRA